MDEPMRSLTGAKLLPRQAGECPLMTGLCEGLVQRGHDVTVVCAFPHHESGQIDRQYRGKLFARDQHNG